MVPEVKKCNVTNCFYNRDNECFANAILVGSEDPVCETFTMSQQSTDKHGQSEVGACHITQCEYNNKMYCHACSDIEVGWTDGNAMCLTYERRAQ